MSPPTQYRLSGRQFYRSKDPTASKYWRKSWPATDWKRLKTHQGPPTVLQVNPTGSGYSRIWKCQKRCNPSCYPFEHSLFSGHTLSTSDGLRLSDQLTIKQSLDHSCHATDLAGNNGIKSSTSLLTCYQASHHITATEQRRKNEKNYVNITNKQSQHFTHGKFIPSQHVISLQYMYKCRLKSKS